MNWLLISTLFIGLGLGYLLNAVAKTAGGAILIVVGTLILFGIFLGKIFL